MKKERSKTSGEGVEATLESISGDTILQIKGRAFTLSQSSQSSVVISLNKSGGVDYTVKAYADSVEEAVKKAFSSFEKLDSLSEAWLKKVEKRSR